MTIVRLIRLMLLLPMMDCALADSEPTAVEIFVDGAKTAAYGTSITVPHNTSTLRFFVNPRVPRVRHRLPSLDPEWRERTDEMRFIIRFLKKNGDPISQEGFPAVGTSPGWNGSLEKSVFTPRRETITVPRQADSFNLVLTSAGPPTLVGVYAVSGIGIRSKGQGDTPGVTYMQDSRVPGSAAKIWVKSGTHPSMASALHLNKDDGKSPVFIINDDDIKAHADWITGITALAKVVPGETLELQWNEVYNSAVGGPFSVVYERLPAGVHRLEIEELSITGTPLNAITAVVVTVRRPFWESVWFWAASLSAAAALATVGGRYLIRKRITRHLEKAQLISDERMRIARDLHDDLGTRLSHISLLSSFAQSSSPNPEVSSNFEQITAMSRELIGALSETVWMLNPRNNQLEALVDFLCRLVSELCRLANIRCRIDAMSVTENLSITHEFRHDMSLAVKEIVNNALKHSGAAEISMTIRLEGKLLLITVSDDGIGMTRHAGRPGLGLDSITQRLANIRGKCHIEPVASNGLKVSLEAPIT